MTGKRKKLSPEELLCLNSILGGDSIHGLHLAAPILMDEQEYVTNTEKKMIAHGLSDTEHRLTAEGRLYLRILKDYKSCSVYLAIGAVSLGLLEDNLCVYIQKEGYGYRLFYCHTGLILTELLKEYPYLAQEQNKDQRRHFLLNEAERKQESKADIELKKYENGVLVLHENIWQDEDRLYLQDCRKSSVTCMGARDIRVHLWNILEIMIESDKRRLR